MIKLISTATVAALALATAGMSRAQETDEHLSITTVEGAFDDVRLDLENAIINRGLVIDYEAFVGEMLNRTAADVGAETQVYTRADTMQFCSAVLSRAMMEADPTTLGFCPYIVFLYEEADAEGQIKVGYRRLPEVGSDDTRAALADVNALLEEIVRETAGTE